MRKISGEVSVMQRILVNLTLALLVTGLAPARAAEEAAGLWEFAEARDFCSTLPQPTRQAFDTHLGEFSRAFHSRTTVDFEDIRLLSAEAARDLLELAIARGLGMIDLVTDPVFLADGPCALFGADAALQEINNLFDLHTLWLIQAQDRRNEPIGMDYFLLGKGELLIGYPREARVSVPDYEVWGSDRFRYQPYIAGLLTVINGVRGIRDLFVLESPAGERGDFRGPFNSRINDLLISVTGDIQVEYSVPFLGNETIVLPNLKIERR